jgi:hypothetical protein
MVVKKKNCPVMVLGISMEKKKVGYIYVAI